MTTIVAVETEDGVEWAWDSQTTTGWKKHSLARSKVFRNGKLVFGVAGRVRDAQLIEQADLPKLKKSVENVDQWVIRQLVPSIQNLFEKQGRLEVVNGQTSSDSSILVCVRDRIYNIGSDFSAIREGDGIAAVGSGSPYALGALHGGVPPQRAVEIASKLDIYTGGSIDSATNSNVR